MLVSLSRFITIVTGIPAGRVPPLQRVLLILSITSTMTIFPSSFHEHLLALYLNQALLHQALFPSFYEALGDRYQYVPDRERYPVVDPVAAVAAPVSWSLVNGERWRGRLSD